MQTIEQISTCSIASKIRSLARSLRFQGRLTGLRLSETSLGAASFLS